MFLRTDTLCLASRGWWAFQVGRQSRDTPWRSDGGVGLQAPLPAGRVRHLHGERGAAKASPQHCLGGGEAQLARPVAGHACKVTLQHAALTGGGTHLSQTKKMKYFLVERAQRFVEVALGGRSLTLNARLTVHTVPSLGIDNHVPGTCESVLELDLTATTRSREGPQAHTATKNKDG